MGRREGGGTGVVLGCLWCRQTTVVTVSKTAGLVRAWDSRPLSSVGHMVESFVGMVLGALLCVIQRQAQAQLPHVRPTAEDLSQAQGRRESVVSSSNQVGGRK